jgi:hypothetical protein
MLAPGASVPSPFGPPPPPDVKPAKPVIRRVIDYQGDPEPDSRNIACVTQAGEAIDLMKQRIPVIFVSDGLRSCRVLILVTEVGLSGVARGMCEKEIPAAASYNGFVFKLPLTEVGPIFERYFKGGS